MLNSQTLKIYNFFIYLIIFNDNVNANDGHYTLGIYVIEYSYKTVPPPSPNYKRNVKPIKVIIYNFTCLCYYFYILVIMLA